MNRSEEFTNLQYLFLINFIFKQFYPNICEIVDNCMSFAERYSIVFLRPSFKI